MKQILLHLIILIFFSLSICGQGITSTRQLNPGADYVTPCFPGQVRSALITGVVSVKQCSADGTAWADITGGGGGGGVTSVGLALPVEFTISGSPVTTTGTLTGSWASQLANRILASPNGASGTPSFRALVEADIPTLSQSKITNLTTDLAAKQPLDSDLTDIATLSPSNDDIIQRKAGAWTNRTVAQFKTDLGLATIATSGSASDLTTGTAAKGRLPGTTVYTDQANTYGGFLQTFQSGANFKLSDPTDTTKLAQFDLSNIATATTRTVNIPNANSTTVQADTGAANQFLTAISAQGLISKAQPSFSNLSGSATTGQLPTTIVYNNQANTYSTGAQDFGSATSLKVPTAAAAAPTANGLLSYDSTSNTLEYGENTTNRIIANLDGTQTLSNKTLTAPTIASFTNATHNHTNAAGGGQLTLSAFSSTTGSGAVVGGTAPTIAGGSITALTTFGIRSSGTGAFDLTLANTENLTAGRTLTIATGDASRTLTLGGNTTINGGTHSGTNTGDQTITLTSDVTGSGTGSFATTIAANVVTNAKLAQVATGTFKGRTTAGTGDVEDLTATQATALLNAVVGDTGSGGTKGLVPAPAAGDAAANKFLKADGTWATTPGGGSGAPTGASYLTLGLDGTLTAERVLTAGALIDLPDTGANGTLTVDVDLSEASSATPAADDTLVFTDVSASNVNAKATVETVFFEYEKVEPRYGFNFTTDFFQETSTTASDNGLAETNSGTGAATSQQASDAINRPGRVRATTGTTATGRAALASGVSAIRLSGGAWFLETLVNVTTLSNGTERFQLVIGFLDTLTAANQVDCVCFVYDEGGVSTGSTATGNWQAATVSNSTRTWNAGASGSSAVTANQWDRLTIIVNAAATSVDFYVNGTLRYTHTTNIPTAAGRELGFGYLLIKSIGTTARTVDTDYFKVRAEYTTVK